MYSINIEILKVSNLKIKMSMVLIGDPNEQFGTREIVKKFSIRGSSYLQFKPTPRVVFEIVPKEVEERTANMQVGFGKIKFYALVRNLGRFIQNFQIPNLFLIRNQKLFLNKEIITDELRLIMGNGNRACKIEYAVVRDNTNPNIEYEGCVFKINSDATYALLTYEEIYGIYDTLVHLDLDTMALHAISLVKQFENLPEKQIGPSVSTYTVSSQDPSLYRGPATIHRSEVFPK